MISIGVRELAVTWPNFEEVSREGGLDNRLVLDGATAETGT
jgi:hypothetical protein